jgi:dCMP deaminase
MQTPKDKWDFRFLDLAKFISNWSKDPSTKVGAVIVDSDNRVISLGYNGFPVGVNDDMRLENRDIKYSMIVHGEMNAILFANSKLNGTTLYTYPFMPCPKCASMIIQAGIKRVVSYNNIPDRWSKDFQLTQTIFTESNIELKLYEE